MKERHRVSSRKAVDIKSGNQFMLLREVSLALCDVLFHHGDVSCEGHKRKRQAGHYVPRDPAVDAYCGGVGVRRPPALAGRVINDAIPG